MSSGPRTSDGDDTSIVMTEIRAFKARAMRHLDVLGRHPQHDAAVIGEARARLIEGFDLVERAVFQPRVFGLAESQRGGA